MGARKLLAEVRSLRAQLVEARRDTARLDYLAKYYEHGYSAPHTREEIDEEMAAQAEQDAEAVPQ